MELSSLFFTLGFLAFIASAIVGYISVEDKYIWTEELTSEYLFCYIITPIVATFLYY